MATDEDCHCIQVLSINVQFAAVLVNSLYTIRVLYRSIRHSHLNAAGVYIRNHLHPQFAIPERAAGIRASLLVLAALAPLPVDLLSERSFICNSYFIGQADHCGQDDSDRTGVH